MFRNKPLALLLNISAGPVGARLIAVGTDFYFAYLISRLNEDGLAASAIITALTNIIKTTTSDSISPISVLLGKQTNEAADMQANLLAAGMLTAMGMAVLGVGIAIGFIAFLHRLHENAGVTRLVVNYFYGYGLGILPNCLLFVNINFAKAHKKTQSILWLLVLMKAVACLLASCFIFAANQDYQWVSKTATAIGFANSLSAMLALAGYSLYLHKKSDRYFRAWPQYNGIKTQAISVLKQFYFGLRSLFDFIYLFSIIAIAARLGTEKLAASEITIQYMLLMAVPATNLFQMAGIIIKTNNARLAAPDIPEDEKQIKKAENLTNYRNAYVISLLLPFISLGLAYGIPAKLAEVFSTHSGGDKAIILFHAKKLLPISAYAIFGLLAKKAGEGLCLGYIKNKMPLYIAGCSQLFGMLLSALVAPYAGVDALFQIQVGVYVTNAIALFIYSSKLVISPLLSEDRLALRSGLPGSPGPLRDDKKVSFLETARQVFTYNASKGTA